MIGIQAFGYGAKGYFGPIDGGNVNDELSILQHRTVDVEIENAYESMSHDYMSVLDIDAE
jgi:hypothetical protein